MGKITVGEVTHFYDRICVAVVNLTEYLKLGDQIHISGKKTDFEQTVSSMQIEHNSITEGFAGQEIALQVMQQVKEGDIIYKLTEE